MLLAFGEKHIKHVRLSHTADVSEAILRPFGRVVILVFPVSTWSGSAGGRTTSLSGKCRGGREDDFSPVNQLKKPPDDGLLATALVVAYLDIPL